MRIERKTNYRVVVEPKVYTYASRTQERIDEDARTTCESIASNIRRRVDDWRDVSVDFDIVAYCSHCGLDWTEGPDEDNQCCEEQLKEFAEKNGRES